MPMKEKWIETKDGSKIRTYPSSLEKNAKAAPNPIVEQVIKGTKQKKVDSKHKK